MIINKENERWDIHLWIRLSGLCVKQSATNHLKHGFLMDLRIIHAKDVRRFTVKEIEQAINLISGGRRGASGARKITRFFTMDSTSICSVVIVVSDWRD